MPRTALGTCPIDVVVVEKKEEKTHNKKGEGECENEVIQKRHPKKAFNFVITRPESNLRVITQKREHVLGRFCPL